MTGWTTFSFSTRAWDGYEGSYGDPEQELCDTLASAIGQRYIWRNYGEVYGRSVSYREWDDDESVLRAMGDLWDYCGVVQANDTSDTGTARMYVNVPSGIKQVDEHSEDAHGPQHNVGAVAAANMTAEYKFPVTHKFAPRESREWPDD